jgi:hypothetical protein
MLGRSLPSSIPAVFNRPRIRSNANFIKQGIRAGKFNYEINDMIRAREGRGINPQDLGRAISSLKDQMARHNNYRTLPLQARPRVNSIPVDWGLMRSNFKSTVEVRVVNPEDGALRNEYITVWHDENLTSEEIRQRGMDEVERLMEFKPQDDKYQGEVVSALQTEIYRRPILN